MSSQPNYHKFWKRYIFNEAQSPNENMIIRLTVFDFDGTLFRSPEEPEGYKGNWWASKASLDKPNVPENPDRSHWFKDTITAAREAIDNKKTFSMLLSGRMEKNFGDRIEELLDQQGITFNYVKLNDSGQDTVKFKIKEIKKVLQDYPKINLIEIWDDKSEHLSQFQAALEMDQTKVVTHHVEKVIDESKKSKSPYPDPDEYEKYFGKKFKLPDVGSDISEPDTEEKSSKMLSTTKISGYDISAGMGRSKVLKDAFENSGIYIVSPDVQGVIKKIISQIDILKRTKITEPIVYGTMGELYKLSNGYVIKFFTDGYQDDVRWFKKMMALIRSGKASKYVLPFLDHGEVDLTQFSKSEIKIPNGATTLYFVVVPYILPYSELLKQGGRDVWEAHDDLDEIRSAVDANYHSFAGDRKAMVTRSMESLKSIGRPTTVTDNEANELIKTFIDFNDNNLVSGDLHPGNFGIFYHGDKAKPTFVIIDI